jgi:hypothetical protein
MSIPPLRHALGRDALTRDAKVAPPVAGRRPAPESLASMDDAMGARKVRYARLARVRIRHTFYNASGGECRDFDIHPTGATGVLLRKLGVLFKPEADGFSVLYNELRTKQLLSYLRDNRDAWGAWTRLSFLLSLRTPTFINFTNLPINTNPALTNFYFTNQEAHARGKMVLLTPGSRVTADEGLPVSGGQLMEPVDENIRYVEILAVSGEPMLCKPRCVPAAVAALKAPYQVTCRDASPPPGETPNGQWPYPPCKDEWGPCSDRRIGLCPPRCTDRLFFDLGTLPEDVYDVERVQCDGDRYPSGRWLYTSLYPMPLCFVSLLFSAPQAGAPGIYPVTLGDADEDDTVTCVEYTLRFTRRRTWWSYYVLSQDGGELYDLRIDEVEPARERAPSVDFLGPCRVRLAGGQLAWRFLSSRPIPLEQRSRLHLQLTGRTGRMRDADVLVARLPVASPQQVLPIAPQAADQARRSLVGSRTPDTRCEKLLRRLRRPNPGGRPGNGEDPLPPPCISDIYVYV